MHHQNRQTRKQLQHVIAVGYAVEAVAAHPGQAQLRRRKAAVQRIGRAGQSARAERRDRHALFAVLKARTVPQQHVAIGQQMMAEGDRLRPLQVGVAGHDEIIGFLRLGRDHAQQAVEARFQLFAFVQKIEPQVERHLVVAAARGVQPFAAVADPLRQLRFHKGVDILGGPVNCQLAALELQRDLPQRGDDFAAFRFVDDALSAEHRRVRNRAADILLRHPAVERDGRVEIVGLLVQFLLEPSFPKGHVMTSRAVLPRLIRFVLSYTNSPKCQAILDNYS